MSSFNISDLLGTPTQHYYEKTKEKWKHLENRIARYQKADSIIIYDMWQLISEYRQSPDQNLFNVEIQYENKIFKPKVIETLDQWVTPDDLEMSNHEIVLRYKNVDEDGSRHMYTILEHEVSNIIMRGTTFYVTLAQSNTSVRKIPVRCSTEARTHRIRHLTTH